MDLAEFQIGESQVAEFRVAEFQVAIILIVKSLIAEFRVVMRLIAQSQILMLLVVTMNALGQIRLAKKHGAIVGVNLEYSFVTHPVSFAVPLRCLPTPGFLAHLLPCSAEINEHDRNEPQGDRPIEIEPKGDPEGLNAKTDRDTE